jgi:hypothetical protein
MVGTVKLNEPGIMVGGGHDDGHGLGGEVRRLIKAIEGKEEAEKENEGEVARLSTRLAHAQEQVQNLEWCFNEIVRGAGVGPSLFGSSLGPTTPTPLVEAC